MRRRRGPATGNAAALRRAIARLGSLHAACAASGLSRSGLRGSLRLGRIRDTGTAVALADASGVAVELLAGFRYRFARTIARERAVDAFLRDLARIAPRFTWNGPDGRLWGRLPGRRAWVCPITAVCLVRQGTRVPVLKYGRAAQRLGLPVEVARDIANAADDPETARVWLRTRLSRIVGDAATERKGE